ncbi:hypothetical protein DFQ27_005350 [Actinomortierella ambigua]|uniref:Uncharacterized protein n=1 Tax=Actinomortierella ambigua TaxID=1343610 RepID=A0A9P6QM97_9FUNG|nr:hypothetical protein DFQ27_005350 [Actinomortierella ambigua]
MAKLSRSGRIKFLLCLNITYFLVEIIVGYQTQSLSLIADSFHQLSDGASQVIALYAIRLAAKTNWSPKYTYGWQRAELLGALYNGIFLLALCFSITMDALERFTNVEPINNPMLVLIVGSVGLGTNLLGLALFHEHGHAHGGHGHSHGHSHSKKQKPGSNTNGDEHADHDHTHDDVEKKAEKPAHGSDLNMHGIFLHVLGDALGSVGVIIAALVMLYAKGEWRYYVDPFMSLVIVAIITYSSIPLVRTTSFILLQGVPMGVEIEDIREQIKSIPDVISVHDLHIWQLTSVKIVASLHVVVTNQAVFERVSRQVKKIMHAAGVHSTTIQPEFPGMHNEKDARKIFPSSAFLINSSTSLPDSIHPDSVMSASGIEQNQDTIASNVGLRVEPSAFQIHDQLAAGSPTSRTVSPLAPSNSTVVVMDQGPTSTGAAAGTSDGTTGEDVSNNDHDSNDTDDSGSNCRLLCIDGEEAYRV